MPIAYEPIQHIFKNFLGIAGAERFSAVFPSGVQSRVWENPVQNPTTEQDRGERLCKPPHSDTNMLSLTGGIVVAVGSTVAESPWAPWKNALSRLQL